MERSKNLQDLTDDLARKCFGISLAEAHGKKICIQCKEKVDEIQDELSRKEYEISGLCPSCQGEFFD